MRGALPHSYYTFFFFFLVLALFRHVYSTNTLSSTETLTISSNRTIVSPGNVFELGFFKTTTSCSRNGDRWYLGIWYKSISKRTYVWVANRDNPLSCSTGTLKIAYTNLALLDHSGTPVWSTNLTKAVKSPVVAELLDNGNFVLRDSKSNCPNRYLWQSFDYPVDTLLPEIKLGRDLKTGRNKFLTSWKSPNDPSSGDLSFKLETKGVPEFYLYKKEFIVYRSCPWNGVGFSRMPTMQKWYVVNNFIETRDEVAYSFKVPNHKTYTRFTLTSEGLLQMFAWIPTLSEWNLFWTLPTENCDLYKVCGSYSYCDMKTSPKCNCIRGFVPKNATAWALRETFYECVRKSRLSCRRDGSSLYGSIFIFILVSYIFYNSDSQNRKSHKTSRENFSFTALRRLEHQSDSQLDEHKCSMSVCFLEWP